MHVTVRRYPQQLTHASLDLHSELAPPAGTTTPYLVKVVQCDGQMAWSSPIYVKA